MSNWTYAQIVPTQPWRSAMTVPRDLSLVHIGSDIYIASKPVEELNKLATRPQVINNFFVENEVDLSQQIKGFQLPCKIDLNMPEAKSFFIFFSNERKETLIIGYDETRQRYYINREESGETDFERSFHVERSAPRISDSKNIRLTIITDISSVELFADDGLSVMTAIYFAAKPFDQIQLQSSNAVTIESLTYTGLKSIW